MEVVDRWTGRRAAALRAALRLTNEAFAEHLGASVRTVANWEAKPDLVLSPAMQEVLDSALERASAAAQQRYSLLAVSAEEAHPRASWRLQSEDSGHLVGVPARRRPSPEGMVESSRDGWRAVREYLTESGPGLAVRAGGLYGSAGGVLVGPGWVPERPVPLREVRLEWDPGARPTRVDGTEAEARGLVPLRAPGHAFPRYSSAIQYVDPPGLFENRHSYRLLELDWEARRMTFGLSTYFDKLDVAEALCHEAAAAAMDGELDWARLPFRSLVGDPFDLTSRPVNPGIATLTIRQDAASGEAAFFLLRRDPTQVTGARHYGLIPAGEFQPASISAESVAADLDLWRNIAREYSEELLGRPEHDGSSGRPVDYDTWPFFRDLTAAQPATYVLGAVVDALSLNAVIATAAVFDSQAFDGLFRDIVARNPEGDVVMAIGRGTAQGLPFDEATVTRFVEREPLGRTSAATLELAWRHRETLLG